MKLSIEEAKQILRIINENYYLGSGNIRPISKSKSNHDDRILINQFLFFRPSRQRQVEALIIDFLKELTHSRIRSYREWLRNERSSEYSLSLTDWERRRYLKECELKSSQEAMAGNCGEMCNSTMLFLFQNKEVFNFQQAEVMSFVGTLNHSFIVINRDPSTDINNYKTWNRDALILDPWLNQVMTMDEFEKFWKENFPMISSKNLLNFYDPSSTRKKLIPAPLNFKIEKEYDIEFFNSKDQTQNLSECNFSS